MSVRLDLQHGQRIGIFTYLGDAEPPHPRTLRVQCFCGNIKIYRIAEAKKHQSCGCQRYGKRATHGLSKTPTYKSWLAMTHRLAKHPAYRNAKIDPRWKDFLAFQADMGERPPGTSIDRIDNNQGYCKENCRWVDQKTQMRNRTHPYGRDRQKSTPYRGVSKAGRKFRARIKNNSHRIELGFFATPEEAAAAYNAAAIVLGFDKHLLNEIHT